MSLSYDIYLVDRVTKETIQLPVKHMMTGGTYRADYDPVTGEFEKAAISDAHLNITYNYSGYYYDATDGDPRFAHEEVSEYYADGTTGPTKTEYGIRGLYGKTGAESIQMLQDMIERILSKYKTIDGKWIDTEREGSRFISTDNGEELDLFADILRRGLDKHDYSEETYTYMQNEGPCDDYWEATAANAIRPLYQLIAMAQLRPDGVWVGD